MTKYMLRGDNEFNAICLRLIASGIKPGKEVIMQADGDIPTALGILRCGAVPVFAEPNKYFSIDEKEIEKAISSETCAVIITHLYGQWSEMNKIVDLCSRNKLMLFKDCA